MKRMLLGIVFIVLGFIGVLSSIILSILIGQKFACYNGRYYYLTYLNMYGIDAYLRIAGFLFFIGVALCVADIVRDKKDKMKNGVRQLIREKE